MNDEGALNDSVFDDSRPFSDTPDGAGVSLDQALREFGPAAIDDLIPRLRALAAALDQAHAAGFVHGRLHPSKVLVTDDGTYVMGRRVPASATLTPEADHYALATIAYEWMFGRPTSGAGDRPVDVRTIPGVDRAALSLAVTRALSPEPSRRFASCADFVDAIAASVIPSLPLMAADADDDPVGPFVPETPPPPPMAIDPVINREPGAGPPSLADDSASYGAPATPFTEAGRWTPEEIREPEEAPTPVAAWQPNVAASAKRPGERFSGLALILAAIVGMVAGFAAGYMARPRALQSGPPQEMAAAGSEGEVKPPAAAPATPKATKAPTPAPEAPQAPQAPARIGRLLVRSTPSGASVEVDGVDRGVTPLALRDLDLGAREITVTRRGYVPEERRIVLTKARPSRSVEVRLSASAADGRAGATSIGNPAVATGALVVDSRPTGAAVTVDGKPRGNTPLTIDDLPPGDYRVTMSLPGYRNFATTVRVVAGERARAAARLTEQEQE